MTAPGVDPDAKEVSKHPDASIPESDLSLAEIEKRRSHPVRWIVMIAIVLLGVVLPYWFGRRLAVNHTTDLMTLFSHLDPRSVAMLSWEVTIVGFVGIAMMIVDRAKTFWFGVFVVGLVCEQFLAGLSLLKLDFWNSTYVMYGAEARVANAANLGIIGAAMGLAVFAVVWIGLLVVIKKTSPLNILTNSWVSFALFIAVEVIAICIVDFGGLVTAV
ncbi:hypothetical protein F6S87_03585 [Bifidobacterium sp. BRDM6]|uniref:Teichoic acid transporter n=1 Tax=Bifidobacterium choloepi TaxID=2614131 RepID=A0A6I5N245_9BIFI|nr:hypothetical protein [Bifidobacterium choloepi]